MNKGKKETYRQYLKEFKAMSRSGTRLYYPYDEEISPRYLAEHMACDTGATYMRDMELTDEGKVIGVHFTRIPV